MQFTSQLLTFIAGASMLANALPLDSKPRQLVPRQKSYNVINVDGGSTHPPQATTVIKATKTVEVINPGPTVTQEVTTTLVQVAPAPAPTTSSSLPTSSASSSTSSSPLISASPPAATPKPIFVTITVGKDDGPTEYYDNGMWHTSYRIKSFPVAVATSIISSSANATATAASA